ncbi:hypothetical protein KY361_05445 [Candidatus Woesearchaeota archaeon]|nr:hypothetical protein [Candidatus Woesearchaeota archaeon]
MAEENPYGNYGIVYIPSSEMSMVMNVRTYGAIVSKAIEAGKPDNFLWVYDLSRSQVQDYMEMKLDIKACLDGLLKPDSPILNPGPAKEIRARTRSELEALRVKRKPTTQ